MSVLDDFFRLGGDSLSATRLLLGVQDEFGIELSMAALVQTPTLARLAARLNAGEESEANFSHADFQIESSGRARQSFI